MSYPLTGTSYLNGFIRISSILHQSGYDLSVVIYGSNLQRCVPLEFLGNNNCIKPRTHKAEWTCNSCHYTYTDIEILDITKNSASGCSCEYTFTSVAERLRIIILLLYSVMLHQSVTSTCSQCLIKFYCQSEHTYSSTVSASVVDT